MSRFRVLNLYRFLLEMLDDPFRLCIGPYDHVLWTFPYPYLCPFLYLYLFPCPYPCPGPGLDLYRRRDLVADRSNGRSALISYHWVLLLPL